MISSALAGDEICAKLVAMWLTESEDTSALPSTYFSSVHDETLDTSLLASFLTERKKRSSYMPFINKFTPCHIQFVEAGVKEAALVFSTCRSEKMRSVVAIVTSVPFLTEQVRSLTKQKRIRLLQLP